MPSHFCIHITDCSNRISHEVIVLLEYIDHFYDINLTGRLLARLQQSTCYAFITPDAFRYLLC